MISKAPVVEIKIIEGPKIQGEIKLNAMGLINNKRTNAEEHYVYFGSGKQVNGQIVNDIIFPKESKLTEKHFFIKYDKCTAITSYLIY